MYYDETASLRATSLVDSSHNNFAGFGRGEHNFDLATSTYAGYDHFSNSEPPTPPPDMHGSDSSLRQPYASLNESQEQSRVGTTSQPLSPSTFSRSSFTQHETTSEPSVSRRSSQTNIIAPSFRIPKTVNDSGGSLSELAAQITCMFWFESSELLQQIEQTPHALFATRPLVKDAIPTLGFRKWVTTILSTTLVGANVVLLALLFVHRLKTLNPAVKGKPGSEYRLLTVALMLGNKFLDDNTYTNKTWAEVSGINVSEVHIMEVEFLSNMKYCLYTSAEQWGEWQTLLGRYAVYVERAMHPVPTRAAVPAPILPPASSIRIPAALPSPPASIQASPPYGAERNGILYAAPSGLTPAPSPLAPYAPSSQESTSRKRSRDDSVIEQQPPTKRQTHVVHYPTESNTMTQVQRTGTYSLPLTVSSAPSSQGQQLPPMSVPKRAMGLVYPNSMQATQPILNVAPDLRPSGLSQSQASSRQHSPYWRNSAEDASRLPISSNLLHPLETSSTTYLEQRGSPYRPVYNVSTLLYPPPSAALQPKAQQVEYSQMHYQHLGKAPQLHTGRLPFITPNNWVDALKPWSLPAVAAVRHPQSALRG